MLPLEGVRVLDLAIMYAGPGSTMYLGDMGADVIKIEQHAGDDSRGMLGTPFLGRNTRAFMVMNRNKRGMVLDLRQPAGKEILHRLAKTSDVLLHNFRPGVAERLGIDYPTLQGLNPRLIYAWVSAFGIKGPYATRGAYDNVIQGYSGLYDVRTRRDGEPTGTGTFISDTSVPMLLGFAIGAALWARERTGRGQLLVASLLGLAIASQSPHWVKVQNEAPEEGESYGDDPVERACPILQCQGGEYLNVALVADEEWRSFCRALGRDDLLSDGRFASLEDRARHRGDLDQIIAPLFRERTVDEWVQILGQAGVPCIPVVRRNNVVDQPYIVQNHLFTTVQHPAAGSTRMFNVPVRLTENPGPAQLSDVTGWVRRPAPLQGQDTDAILGEIGYSPDEIRSLHESNVVA